MKKHYMSIWEAANMMQLHIWDGQNSHKSSHTCRYMLSVAGSNSFRSSYGEELVHSHQYFPVITSFQIESQEQ